jgi:predicted MPP superfamily phosphohydrolase
LRRIGGVVAVLLAVLVPTTLIAVRSGHWWWLAWPGYLWLALMFYLLITLAVLEIPRLAVLLFWRVKSPRARRTLEVPQTLEAPQAPEKPQKPRSSQELKAPPTLGTSRAPEEPRAIEALHAPKAQQTAEAPKGPQAAELPEAAGDPESSEAPALKAPEGPRAPGTREEATPGGVDRRLLLNRGMAIFAGLTAAGITGYGVKMALGPPRVNRIQLPLAKLPRTMDGLRLAVVSDIHLGPFSGPDRTRRIVDQINSVQADIVCVVGDLVDGSVAELGRSAAPLADIQSRRGAYFVTGNHEYYSGYKPWIDEVAQLGMRPLRNQRVEIDGLDLAGVNDLGGTEVGDPPDFAAALGDRDAARPVVLMAHQPVAVHDAAPFGVDLQVSGHTHGGQMAPFNLLVKLQQPIVSGYGTVDGVPVFVTNGAGTWGPPVRVGAPPQVTVIELRTV